MSAAAQKPFRLTGWHVLICICAFFGVIIAFDSWFATLAVRTFSGEVASNPYEAGIAFNKTLAARQAERALGWSVEADSSDPARLVLVWTDRDGAPLDGLTITGQLTRPATETGAQSVTFTPVGEGRYAVDLTSLAAGGWDLAASAVNARGETFEVSDRIKR